MLVQLMRMLSRVALLCNLEDRRVHNQLLFPDFVLLLERILSFLDHVISAQMHCLEVAFIRE